MEKAPLELKDESNTGILSNGTKIGNAESKWQNMVLMPTEAYVGV